MASAKKEALKASIRAAIAPKRKRKTIDTTPSEQATFALGPVPVEQDEPKQDSRASRQIVIFTACAPQKDIIREAARVEDMSMSAFILTHVLPIAAKILKAQGEQ